MKFLTWSLPLSSYLDTLFIVFGTLKLCEVSCSAYSKTNLGYLGLYYDFPRLPHGTCFGLLHITKNISLHSITPKHWLLISRFLSFSNWFLLRKINYFLNLASSGSHHWPACIRFSVVCGASRHYHYCVLPAWSPTGPWYRCLRTTSTVSYFVPSLKFSPVQLLNNSDTSTSYFPFRSVYSIRIQPRGLFKWMWFSF